MSKKKVSDTKKVVVKSLVDAGLPYREISETVGVSLGHISTIVKEFEANKELVAWFKQNKAEILLKAQHDNLNLQEVIRKTITEEEIKGWTPDQRQRWYSALGINFGIVFDKSRLENDESSSNLKILVAHIQAAQERWFEKQDHEFAEWVDKHRRERIPIPSQEFKRIQEEAQRHNVDVSGLIFQDVPNTSSEDRK